MLTVKGEVQSLKEDEGANSTVDIFSWESGQSYRWVWQWVSGLSHGRQDGKAWFGSDIGASESSQGIGGLQI